MDIKFYPINKILVAQMQGDLDHYASVTVREKIDRAIENGHYKKLILDFTNLSFMDSSGVGVIIGRYKYISQLGGQLSIANTNPTISRVMKISGITKIVKIFTSVQDAVKNM